MLRGGSLFLILIVLGLGLGTGRGWLEGHFDVEPAAVIAGMKADPATLSARLAKESLLRNPFILSRQTFLDIAFQMPRKNLCEVLSPDPIYVEEMLVRFDEEGSRTYERRVALIVGNSDYNTFGNLKNPSNDATSVARMFAALGFTVHRGIDLTASQLEDCLESFYADIKSKKTDVALFFYAGHGVQLTGEEDGEKRNYLLTTDATIGEGKVAVGFKQIDVILKAMRSNARQSVFFYDACRTAPVGNDLIANVEDLKVRGQVRVGAAPVETEQASEAGIYIAFASAPNHVADDEYERGAPHSPFTRAILNHLATPGSSLKEAMSHVSKDVSEFTAGGQTPWTSSSLTTDLRLNGGMKMREAVATSAEFASQSTVLRTQGMKEQAIASALKGIPVGLDYEVGDAFQDAHNALIIALESRELRLQIGASQIRSVNWSATGDRILTVSLNGRVTIHESNIGGKLAELPSTLTTIKSAGLSLDGLRIVTGSHAGTVRIWDAQTGVLLKTMAGHTDPVTDVAFSPDGQKVASSSRDRTSRVWSVATGLEITLFDDHERMVNSVAWSPNGKWIVTASEDEDAKIWNAETGKAKKTLGGLFGSHKAAVLDASWSPNGQAVVTASADSTAVVWNAETGRKIVDLGQHEGTVVSAAYSSNSQLVVTSSLDGSVRVWDIEDGSQLAQFTVVSDHFPDARFSPNDELIALASASGFVHLWNWSHKCGCDLPQDQPRVGTISKETTVLAGHSNDIKSVSWSTDGKKIITASHDGTAKIWEVETGQALQTLSGHTGQLTGAIFSKDGKTALTVSMDRSARLWDIETGGEIKAFEHDEVVGSGALSSDGRLLIAGLWNGDAAIWDTETGSQLGVLAGHNNEITSVVFSPDDRWILTASIDGTARIWDVVEGREHRVFTNGSNAVLDAAYSPNGRRIVIASLDGSILVWDVESTRQVTLLKGHDGWVRSARFSPDGQFVISASDDRTARIWRAGAGDEVAVLRGHLGGVSRAAFSPDGQSIATSSLDDTAVIWGLELLSTELIGEATELIGEAFELLPDDTVGEIERNRIRYWKVSQKLLA